MSSSITKFTNGLVLKDGKLVAEDVWVSAATGRIISPQSAFYSAHTTADQVVDLKGRILSPGFLDVQLNGAYDFDFSVPVADYAASLKDTTRQLITHGVTSFVPTVTSQLPEVYQQVLPSLGPAHGRNVGDGAESLGAHVEGPFLSPARNGIHTAAVLREANAWSDIEHCYGPANIGNIRKITAAPELANMVSLIPDFVARGIVYSIGHSDATLEQAQTALASGARMVTHMFNAMRPFGHREPGIFGLLGQSRPPTPSASPTPSRSNSPSASPSKHSRRRVSSASSVTSKRSTPRSRLSVSTTASDLDRPDPLTRPYFGLIADGIHLSPQALKIAYAAHPRGAILVTDAMRLCGMPDGIYPWTNDEKIIKQGTLLTLEKNGRIAGSAVTLLDCINNFLEFTGCEVAEALRCVTETPAKMLGGDVAERKGQLEVGKDADLVILEAQGGKLTLDAVWKFGIKVV